MTGEIKVLTVGADASSLDIFLSANGIAVSGQYVGFQLVDAANVQAASGLALNPELGRYTASGVIPAGYQLGLWHVNWDVITAGGSFIEASEPFTVNDATISIGFVPPADKFGNIYDAVRIDIGDPEGAIFDDDFLKRVLIKAVRRLNHMLGLSRTSRPRGVPGNFGGPRLKILQMEVDVEAGTIVPSNDELCDLIILMMEYIIITGETSAMKRLQASGPFSASVGSSNKDGIMVRNADGVTIDVSVGRLQTRATLQRLDVETRKAEIEAAIKLFWGRMTGNFGKFIW
jgi:hypothetical protein